MRRIVASTLLAMASLMAQAQPPRVIQIVREPINPGAEDAYELVENSTAVTCAELECPHPHLALEPLVGPKEVWWFNFFESEAQRLQVSKDYQRNRPLMEVLTRNSERKSQFTGQISDVLYEYRPDLSTGAHWDLSGVQFIVVTPFANIGDRDGFVFEAPDGSHLLVQPLKSSNEVNRIANDGHTIVLAVRPSWGMPAPEWIAADRDFWSVNPCVYREQNGD